MLAQDTEATASPRAQRASAQPAAGWDESSATIERSEPNQPRRPIGLLLAGVGTFAASYAFTVVVGLQLASSDSGICSNCDKASVLYAPVLGPWLFLGDADGTDGKVVSALMGAAQGIGVILIVAGLVRFIDGAPPKRRPGFSYDVPVQPRVDFAAFPLRDGGMATVRLTL